MTIGDLVWWHWQTSKGWGYSHKVPAKVIGFSSSRVKIATLQKAKGKWLRIERFVRADKISVRIEAHQGVDSLVINGEREARKGKR